MEIATSIRATEKKYCSAALIAAIAGAVICIAMGYKPMGKSLIMGTLFSIINFVVMGETLPARIDKTRAKNIANALLSVTVRYVILAIPLVMALKSPQEFNLIGVIVGIFMVQVMILSDHLASIIFSNRKKQV